MTQQVIYPYRRFMNFSSYKVCVILEAQLGGSPGLVVSYSRGCGFESQHHMLEWLDIFSHLLVVKIVLFV